MEKLISIFLLLIAFSCTSSKKEPENKPAENSTPPAAESSSNQMSSASNSKQMASNNTSVRDYFNVPGPIRFNNQDFLLSWSSNPSPNYFKHEYIPKGTDPEKYNEMIMLELLLGDVNMDAIVAGKINELNARKATDPMVKYESTTDKKSGEKHFSFLLSAGDDANKVLEWNFYRYLPYAARSGEKGVTLFAYSKRAYGTNTQSFMDDLVKNRRQYGIDFIKVNFPEPQLK
jgi:hypothetical protein